MIGCMCGATDCPFCGPAQGYRVFYSPTIGFYNPEIEEIDMFDVDDDNEALAIEDEDENDMH